MASPARGERWMFRLPARAGRRNPFRRESSKSRTRYRFEKAGLICLKLPTVLCRWKSPFNQRTPIPGLLAETPGRRTLRNGNLPGRATGDFAKRSGHHQKRYASGLSAQAGNFPAIPCGGMGSRPGQSCLNGGKRFQRSDCTGRYLLCKGRGKGRIRKETVRDEDRRKRPGWFKPAAMVPRGMCFSFVFH